MARRIWGRKAQQQQPMQGEEQMQAQQMQGGYGGNPELQARAEMEMKMLNQTAQYKKMKAQMKPNIGEKEVRKASQILRKYKEGKARLEEKIVANEEFWKLRQWNYMNDGKGDFKPATAWLWACIQSRHSDIMDNYPTCNFLAREAGDVAEAKKLSAIVPVIMEQNRYEETYSDVSWYALKQGGCVQGIFWDKSKHNGLGDIVIKKIDFINLFWESGVTNIQDSRNVFHTELVSNDVLEQTYPQCVGKLGGKSVTLAKYLYDDNVDTSNKSVVVDWYYHKYVNGKKTLQYVKYVNDVVLYATENETQRPEKVTIDPETRIPLTVPTGKSIAERGLYDHGMYPFVTMPLYPIEGSLCGYGLTDIGRDTQLQIDMLNKAITDNAIAGAKPRYFIKNDGSVHEEEYADMSKDFIHVEGNLGEENIRPVDHKPLDSIYVNVLQQKIDEMKFITSNQDVSNGSVPTGVTSGNAISALQESHGKNSRTTNRDFHRKYRDVCYFVVELMRQFYDMPRTFRVMGADMKEQFVTYDNSGLVAQPQVIAGQDMGMRLPEFDIEITSEKSSPYKKMETNELGLNLYSLGIFNPQMSDQALAVLSMMDFNKKDEVVRKVQQNGTLFQMVQALQQMAMGLASQIGDDAVQMVAQQLMKMSGGQPLPQQMGEMVHIGADNSEHPFNTKAREQTRASTQVE